MKKKYCFALVRAFHYDVLNVFFTYFRRSEQANDILLLFSFKEYVHALMLSIV